MKKFASLYMIVVIVWALVATLFGVNSIPGAGKVYNFGRNFPAAIIWPIGVIKSPYTFYKWATSHSRPEIFQVEYVSCLNAMRSENYCGCAIDIMEKNFTEAEIKSDKTNLPQGIQSDKYKIYIEKTKQCL